MVTDARAEGERVRRFLAIVMKTRKEACRAGIEYTEPCYVG